MKPLEHKRFFGEFYRLACWSMILGFFILAANQPARAQQKFTHTFTGEPLQITLDEGEEMTPAVKEMLAKGTNPYIGDEDAIDEGDSLFLRNCAVCHGIDATGKMGPDLTDATWVYEKNKTNKGFFETVYGGAGGLMKGLKGYINLDEMLIVMAYIRSLAN